MITTAAYLNKTYKVAEIRALAKLIGLKGVPISRTRKAELIDYIVGMIDFDHDVAEYMRASEVKPHTPKYTISLMDYPVPYGRPVTEQHARICRERGHVSYVKDGIDTGICPRCGEMTTSEEQITENEIDPVSDSVKFVSEINDFLTARFITARNARESLPQDSLDFDAIVQIENDLRRAMGEFERTLAFINDSTPHMCDLNLREVGMSGCSYGCKIYRCETCGHEREIHNATYGAHTR